MDLRQINYFLRVAELRSITAAAADLNMTQPTLTKSIKLLEQELCTKLFQRLPRGLELTEAGHRLVRHAEAIRNQVRDAHGEIEAMNAGLLGFVTIGAGPAWLRSHLPLAVARASANQPELQVRIVGGFDESLLRDLTRGKLDFVIAELPWTNSNADFEIEGLTSDQLCVCARTGHPLVGRKHLDLADLMPFPWVLPVKATRARQRLDALFIAENAVPPKPAVETDSMAFMLALVRNSDALTYTTATTIHMPEGVGLSVLPVSKLVSERRAGVVRRKDSWLSPAAEALLGELRAICALEPAN